MLAWAGLSMSLLVWVILRERDPIRVVFDYVLLILNLAYVLYLQSPSIDLSFYSLVLIIIYASALAILFGLIVMIYTVQPSRSNSLSLPFLLPFFSTSSFHQNKPMYPSLFLKFLFWTIISYIIIKIIINIVITGENREIIGWGWDIIRERNIKGGEEIGIVSILYHHIYDLSLIYNSYNLILLVLLLLVAMLMLILVLI